MKKYCIRIWGSGSCFLFEKLGDKKYWLLAFQIVDSVWEFAANGNSRQQTFQGDVSDISREEAVIILFSCREPA